MKYYFDHIKDGQICEGYTVIYIANYEAEIANDDPDAVLVAIKNDGRPKENLKWKDRFRLPAPPTYGFFQLTDTADLENLSKSNIGEGRFEIEIPLDIDILTDVVFDHLPRIPRGYLYVEHVNWPRSFRLSCARWEFLGELRFSRRDNDATILMLDSVPRPTYDELSSVKMSSRESDLFQYGKQKHRGEVIRRLFNSLRYDRVWQSRQSNEEIFIESIDSFEKTCNIEPRDTKLLLPLDLTEDQIQTFFEEIIGENFHKQDWGGELNDLATSQVRVQGKRLRAVFLLKGNGTKGKLRISKCGKNGDQIVRLAETPADLYVIQHIDEIDERVVSDLRSKIQLKRSKGEKCQMCIIDGTDTVRILKAYEKI